MVTGDSRVNILDVHAQELRRGTVVLACLVCLRVPGYGYALSESLEAFGISVDGNTLYPLLRRLERQGLLTSDWNTDDVRPRKFYRTTSAGDAAAAGLLREWEGLGSAIRRLTEVAVPAFRQGDGK